MNNLRTLRLRPLVLFLILSGCLSPVANWKLAAAELSDKSSLSDGFPANFAVRSYVVHGNLLLPTNTLAGIFSKHTGGKVDLPEVVRAAKDLQAAYLNQGYLPVSVAVAPGYANGIITFNVFQAMEPQIVVSGQRYVKPGNEPGGITNSTVAGTAIQNKASGLAMAGTNIIATPAPVFNRPLRPATPAEMAAARAALFKTMADLDAAAKDTRVHVVSTNAGPRFAVEKYLVAGNSVLTPGTIAATLTNIDGAYGTNVSFDGIRTVVTELQKDYSERGYMTVAVTLPEQKLTNATVKVQVTEGRLAVISVKGNRYFSSDNVLRQLPSLHTNTILNGLIFQTELNRANANQDRQIYPVIGPGPDPGTSALTLKVKDQLPLHGKVDFNNESSPGTPDFRVNSSIVYNNLFQDENALGLQYSFSPQQYKDGSQWSPFDQPAVVNYSGFYRIPLGVPESVEQVIEANPGSFGYSEATRRFNLPPPTGQAELTFYASRATIDTGIEMLKNATLLDNPFVREISQQEFQQGLTINQDAGFELSQPLPPINDVNSTLSGGLDFKTYSQENFQTNVFTFNEWTKGPNQNLIERTSHDYVITPITQQSLNYLPLNLNYNGSGNDFMGAFALGLSLSANLWYSGSVLTNGASQYQGRNSLANIIGVTNSSEVTGHWVILRPNFSQTIMVYTNWPLTFRADGQWANEPLISNEQFGMGGINSVRGYHEGELFADTGWHVSVEQQTPAHQVGIIYGDQPLTLRGTVYMDYAKGYLLDPQGRPGSIDLWGTGFGFTAAAGSHWQARFLFSVPLISTTTTMHYQPYFNFDLTAQF